VGAAYGKYVTGTANPEVECTKGDLLSVIDPSCFVDLDQFKSEVDDFIAEVKATPNVFIPGDMEIRNIRKFKKDGVSIDKKLEIQLKDLCQEVELRWDDVVEK
jgi:L-2-hydroxycarboxylate dehydrogenase (NAD+)